MANRQNYEQSTAADRYSLWDSNGATLEEYLNKLSFKQLLSAAYITIEESALLIKYLSKNFNVEYIQIFRYYISIISLKMVDLFRELKEWRYCESLGEEKHFIENNEIIPYILELFTIHKDVESYISKSSITGERYNLKRYLLEMDTIFNTKMKNPVL